MDLAVKMKDVWVQFGNQTILEGIDLEVEAPKILTIVGPNGSGKSTLLKTLLGQITPVKGQILLFGQPVAAIIKKGWIGYLPQHVNNTQTFPILTKDIVALSRYAQKKPFSFLNKSDHSIIDKALEQVEMQGHRNMPFSQLSGGQKQRVLIARALALQPKLLILDEPSTGLDAVAQESFYALLKKLKEDNRMTILMVSHDIGAVSGFVDQIACLNRKIHFHGDSQSCIPPEALQRVFGKNIHFVLHDDHCKTCKKGL